MNRLVACLSRLPGIGNRSAQRLAFHLLKQPPQEAAELAGAIAELKRNTRHCSICFNLTESDPCPICADPKRDHTRILVVEQPNDVATFESTGGFNGVYHVLMGRLSPLDGIGPGELNITALLKRVESCRTPAQTGPNPKAAASLSRAATGPGHGKKTQARSTGGALLEVILGTGPTLEGDGTALYLAGQLAPLGVAVTRLARGLPTGSSLELVGKAVLADSIQGRQAMGVD